MGILIQAGDEERGAERVARLIGRYAERFDPPSRAWFYASLAAKVGGLQDAELAFVHGDDVPKKQPRSKGADEGRKQA